MTNQARAEELANYFFTNGQGQKADRLVLMQDGSTHDLGGWGRRPFIDKLQSALDAAEQRGAARWTQRFETIRDKWREEARLARPLESARVSFEKRARTQRYMLFTRCADELDAALRETIAETIPSPPQAASSTEDGAEENSR